MDPADVSLHCLIRDVATLFSGKSYIEAREFFDCFQETMVDKPGSVLIALPYELKWFVPLGGTVISELATTWDE